MATSLHHEVALTIGAYIIRTGFWWFLIIVIVQYKTLLFLFIKAPTLLGHWGLGVGGWRLGLRVGAPASSNQGLLLALYEVLRSASYHAETLAMITTVDDIYPALPIIIKGQHSFHSLGSLR